MSTGIQRETAEIFEFPKGGRAARGSRLGGHFDLSPLERELASLPFANAVIYDSWYHDAAIAEDDRAGKH